MPAGTQSGRRFRLAGKGMPVLRQKQTGDMYVQVTVETPQNLTKRQRELLAEFEKLSSHETQPEAAGFFGKVKDFFGARKRLTAIARGNRQRQSVRCHDSRRTQFAARNTAARALTLARRRSTDYPQRVTIL